MIPLYVLLTSFSLSVIVLYLWRKKPNWPLAGRVAISTMLVFTAIGHLMFTAGMAKMIPDFIPSKTAVVYFTGLIEIAAAFGIHLRTVRKMTGILVCVFFILILPANINASMDQLNYKTGQYNGPGLTYLWFRIPFQLFLIGWTFWCVISKK
ncbi:hypothetical protein FKX85_05260 [Echinicola soli]|uniref:DoxX-like family protein n=1 Tax=Echinicola soli TaxID=2591634 RepID=A0A514CF60_9BACT|nr:hypothetical protein [Echinicola soli]QDH78471.1 hypothetical protein FKX85_05260 [Echinicola soli]